MIRKLFLFALLSVICPGIPLAGEPSAKDPAAPSKKAIPSKKIVFIAGPKDHGGPGAHEYEKDLRLLQQCLESSLNIKGIATKLYVGRAPEDIAELEDAAAIVIHSSGDRLKNETHGIFPQHQKENPGYSKAEQEYLNSLDKLMKRGMGIVVLHYSLIIENPRACSYFLDWIGGYHKNGMSRVKIDRSDVQLATPGHPILRGVQPWTTDHEYYFNQFFKENDKRFVPILTANLPSDNPERHVIAWAVERDGGGRGFAFTGGHFHKNMRIEDYRQMLLNGIVWAARIPVPREGVASSVPKE